MDDTPGVSDEPEFLTVKQSARRLNVSVGCVYRLCSTGKLPHYKFGDGQGAVRLRRDDLLEFVGAVGSRSVTPTPRRASRAAGQGHGAGTSSSIWMCGLSTPAGR